MAIEAPYLNAIQKIDGTTPGEKQKTIHDIARQIARLTKRSVGDSQAGDAGTRIPDVPEPLKPLVSVEVAKILHQYEGIIEALKSEDVTVVSRAIQAKWFFDGSDTRLVNAEYFLNNLFPNISLYARFKVVKSLATNLKNSSIAADFFVTVLNEYGVSQATPLLLACEEEFAFKMIIDHKIILSLRMAEDLYRKYPNLVIKYLMLGKPDDEGTRNLYRVNIYDYIDFLPTIANDHLDDFMNIYHLNESFNVKLGKRAVNTFIKTRLDLLINEPQRYLKLLSLKTVTHKLSADDFAKMFKNLLPVSRNDFSYDRLNDYLTYYKPEEEKIKLVLNAFREKYGKDLTNYEDLVDSDLLEKLPPLERVKLARLKLKEDADWHIWDCEHSWRIYLPINESILMIKKEIARSSDSSKRGQFLKQLILTSKINEDKDSLLNVLNYIYDRHRNEPKYVFYNCLLLVCDSFDVAKLSAAHWESLDKYIKFTEMQKELFDQSPTMTRVLEAGLHYCFLNNLPMDNYVRLTVDMNVQSHRATWNILKQFPELEKKFLDLFIDTVPKQYPVDNKIWQEKRGNIIYDLSNAVWDFNYSNKNLNRKFKNISVKDYPWLLENIRSYIIEKCDDYDWMRDRLLNGMRRNEWDSYSILVKEIDQFWNCDMQMSCDLLRAEPKRILDNWEKCFDKITSQETYSRESVSFVWHTRWHQKLPINLFDESLSQLDDAEKFANLMVSLAYLTDGETFSKIIEPWIPNNKIMDISHPDAQDNHSKLIAIASNFCHLNPPPSLDVVAKFCYGDYLQLAIRFLTSVCHRLAVAKVIPFAEMLTKSEVSVSKHGIRLIYSTAPLDSIYKFLANLWETYNHTSIRRVVFSKIYDLFCKQVDPRSWTMIKKCMDSLTCKDDSDIFKVLTTLSTVPNEYLYEYIKSTLDALKIVEKKADNPKTFLDLRCQLIQNIDGPIVDIIPDEYSQHLIKDYLFVFDYDVNVFTAGWSLTINSYLLFHKNYEESRFEFFANFFRESVQNYWDKSHPKCFKFYPMNYMTRIFFTNFKNAIDKKYDVRIFESLLQIFSSNLQPHQDAMSYVDLIFAIEYHNSESSSDFGNKMTKKIPELIETFSPECVTSMSQRLYDFLSNRTFNDTENQEERLMTIIEIFAKNGNTHCAFVAVNMLFDNTSKDLNKRYKIIVKTLRSYNHPGISWYLNDKLANQTFVKDKNE